MASSKKGSNAEGTRPARTGAVATFILSQPVDASADSVVEAGKAAGHAFSRNYVYAARARAKNGRSATKATGKRAGRGASKDALAIAARASRALAKLSEKGITARPATRPDTSLAVASSGTERELAALIVQVGTHRAEEILNRVRVALSKLSF